MKKNGLLVVFVFIVTNFLFAQPSATDWQWTKDDNPVLKPGMLGQWDAGAAYMPCVIKANGIYHMWYTGINFGWNESAIGYATSPDGKNWTKYGGNPVLEAGGLGSFEDEEYVSSPDVIYDGEIFHMWYYAYKSNNNGAIGYATSTNGYSWTKYEDNPVLPYGEEGDWDDFATALPSVLFEDNQYKMWYGGGDGPSGSAKIGFASSNDGISWEKFPDPLFEKREDESKLWGGKVVKSKEGFYYMWYTEGPWSSVRLDHDSRR